MAYFLGNISAGKLCRNSVMTVAATQSSDFVDAVYSNAISGTVVQLQLTMFHLARSVARSLCCTNCIVKLYVM